MEIIDRARGLVEGLLKEKELELVELTYRKQGPDRILRLIVDKQGGVTLDECALVNERLGEMLDKEDLISERYLLEVWSPGLDRPLKTAGDFQKALGKSARIHTYGPVEDNREHIGKIVSCDTDSVTVELNEAGAQRKIPLSAISKAKLEVEL